MDFIFITNDVSRAAIAERAGIDRVMVDLEVNGKEARQGHLDTVRSRHSMEDVAQIRATLRSAKLLVRINPFHDGTAGEVEECLARGAEILMLPMFTQRREVDGFIELVGGRARTCLLLETPQSAINADVILDCDGIDEVHVGLNDLHLGMGLAFMFELLTNGVVEDLAGKVLSRGIKFGFGGVARLGSGALSARLILSEHARLGSTQVILSRDFQKVLDEPGPGSAVGEEFVEEVRALRAQIQVLHVATQEELAENSREVKRVVAALVGQASP